MEAFLKTRTMRNKLISAAAASAMTLPLFAPAAVVNNTDSDIRIAYEKTEPTSTRGQQSLYAKLKKVSRKVCNSSTRGVRITKNAPS